ncbi:MFS transporter [Reyranella sp.]|uniref:MFS transporter n=1 Tax=Reyranella sp. TaxID=1929291 RepID=UPI003783CF9D
MAAHHGVPGQAPLTRPAFGLAIVGLGASLAPLDIAVNVALPDITRHFRLVLGDVQWLVICYVLVYGSLMLVCGKLGDLFGHRLIFRTGLAISAIGCAACAAAPDWPLFLWARASQGIGTALALSCTPALATSLYPESARTRALAGFASSMAIASAVGPFLGGALVELWGWPAVYWVRVPIALAALALSGLLPAPKPNPRPFDALGAVLLALCMSTLLLSLVLSQRREVPGLWPAALFVAALVLLFFYVRRAGQVPEPIIRPGLFADPAFAVPNAMNALANLAGFSILLLTPYYLVNVLKLSALMSGLVLALAYAGSLTGAPLSAWLVRRIGQRPTAFVGVAFVGLGLLPLGFTDAATPLVVVAVLLILEGIGQGLLTVAYTDIVTATLAQRDRGVAGSLALLTRTLGIVSGASVLTALQAHGAGELTGIEGFLAGYRFAFVAAGGGLLAVLALSRLVPGAWAARTNG